MSVGLEDLDPSLLFRRSISDASLEAIRSVTHLVLALGGAVDLIPFRTERKQAGRPDLLPSGSFWGIFLLCPSLVCVKLLHVWGVS